MTLDDGLVKAVDSAVRKMHITRSAFARTALREALRHIKVLEAEHKHRQGYASNPVSNNEFSVWEDVQVWGDR